MQKKNLIAVKQQWMKTNNFIYACASNIKLYSKQKKFSSLVGLEHPSKPLSPISKCILAYTAKEYYIMPCSFPARFKYGAIIVVVVGLVVRKQ